jgi:DNA-binding CsgD family transcriptional regulator
MSVNIPPVPKILQDYAADAENVASDCRGDSVWMAQRWRDGQFAKAMEFAAAAADPKNARCGQRVCVRRAQFGYARMLTRIRELEKAAWVLAGVTPAGGPDGLEGALELCQAEISFAAGDLKNAVEKADCSLRMAESMGNYSILAMGHTIMAMIAVRQRDVKSSLEYASQLGNDALLGDTILPEEQGFHYISSEPLWAVTQVLEAQYGIASVARHIDSIIMDERLTCEFLLSQPAAGAWLVRGARKLDHEAAAVHAAKKTSEIAEMNRGFSVVEAAAMHAVGLLERDSWKLQSAVDLHVDKWAMASAQEDMAGLLSLDRPKDSIEILHEAIDAYRSVGAIRDASRVASRIRELGERPSYAPLHASHSERQIGHLTETEFAVADLVSQGLTNGQAAEHLFISTHTVAFHLKKIFRKLNITSRVELARVWSRQPQQ